MKFTYRADSIKSGVLSIKLHKNPSYVFFFLTGTDLGLKKNNNVIVAAFQGMHESPAKHSYAWLPRKCDYGTDRQTDRQTPDYKNLPWLRTGTGISTRVSKMCSQRRSLPSRGRCKSLTPGWIPCPCTKSCLIIFLLPLSTPVTKPHFLKQLQKRFLVRKRRQLA